MEKYLIDFKSIDWVSPAPGLRYKAYVRNNRKIRLVEFTEELDEKDWCTKGHVGYVLEGRFSTDFNGKIIHFKAGDGLFIPPGEENKHKAKVAKGERVSLILFEEI